MSKPGRVHNFGTYFVTTSCWDKRRFFHSSRTAELFLEMLEEYRPHFLLHAFVVMPDHVHIILTPQNLALERVMQHIKGGFSHALGQLGPKLPTIWQRGFTDHRIRNSADFEKHRTYIHQNPVMAGLVQRPEDYEWSSLSGLLQVDPYPSG